MNQKVEPCVRRLRFVLSNTEDVDLSKKPELTEDDALKLQALNALTEEVTDNVENYRLHLAAEKVYDYLWHVFADKIIEESKSILNGEDENARLSRQWTLFTILTTNLKLLHPFMPFVTEAIYQELPFKKEKFLMIYRLIKRHEKEVYFTSFHYPFSRNIFC